MSAISSEVEWSRDYAAYMRCDAGDEWLPAASSQVSSWLREKGFDVDIGADGDYARGHRSLEIRTTAAARARDFSILLVEETPQGTFTTRLLAHDETGTDDWIHLEITNSRGLFVNRPRLVERLVDVLPLGDGNVAFTAGPQVFRIGDVDRLVELLADDDRHALVLVAGTENGAGIPFDAFRDQVAVWARELTGLAQVVVLDPLATTAFEARVGVRFSARPWTIRTYLPGVDFADENTARQHRILGTSRLGSQSDRALQYLLGEIARRQAGLRPVPRAVESARRRFDRLENRRLLQAISAPEVAVGPPEIEVRGPEHRGARDEFRAHVAQIGLVKQILKLEEITEASLRKVAAGLARAVFHSDAAQKFEDRINALQGRVEALEDRNREVLAALDDQQMETEVALLDVEQREARIRWLESRLKEADDFEALYAEVPDQFVERRPGTFAELLQRIDELPGVEFSGEPAETERLNAIDTNEAALRTAWDAVLTLADYAKARSCGDRDAGLDQFIKATPAGYRSFPPGKWAHTETRATMRGWGEERRFPVPVSVDDSGTAEMKAHFKLARIGMASPRMHVLDHHPVEPVVYIGYIGTHLTNTKTN